MTALFLKNHFYLISNNILKVESYRQGPINLPLTLVPCLFPRDIVVNLLCLYTYTHTRMYPCEKYIAIIA